MSNDVQTMQRIIRERVTEKVMCSLEHYEAIPSHIDEKNRKSVHYSLEIAGWAPFHYPRDINDVSEPWRAYILWKEEAYQAAKYLVEKLGIKTKEPKLATACSALILITWLPEEPSSSFNPDQEVQIKMRNEEHLAASSAMVQNLLLMLTAYGMGTYWSSGGKLRSPEIFEYLKIPQNESLLAAIFVEYAEMKQIKYNHYERKPGAHRNNRSLKWIHEISIL
ncbi:MAG: nitroreductase family protein [Verrucomicrobiota bacterium]